MWKRTTALHIREHGSHSDNRNAGDPTVDDSEDSIPSLVDDSLEHRDGERPEAVPSERFPAYMPPRTQVFWIL